MRAKLRFNTAVGKKVLMAVTGLAMCIFLVGHLAGNLQLLWNKDQFNGYAHFLTVGMAPVVLIMELGLLGILLIHVGDAIVLLRQNYAARPTPYHSKTWARTKSKRSRKSWSSTLMMWSGTAILFFIVFHVWQMKYHNPVVSEPVGGGHNPTIVTGGLGTGVSAAEPGQESVAKDTFDLAQMVVNELSHPIMAAIYITVMLLLGMHLWHAVSSSLNSLGANNPRYAKVVQVVGNLFTLVICGGYIAIVAAIVSGLIK